jgi:Taurine catabolism dioxygenase TauD, TfdA family
MEEQPIRRPLTDPCAWQGREMTENPRWQRDLTPAEIGEIDRAQRAVQGMAWREVTAEAFPLPGMTDRFAEIAEELEEGSGMVKLRGLPVDRYSAEELRRIWFGIGCHLGRPVFQNRRGELMREIRDEGSEAGQRYGQVTAGPGADKPFLSSYARTLTNGALRFHTDRTDVVGLLCVQQAEAGGVSRLCSSVAIHN